MNKKIKLFLIINITLIILYYYISYTDNIENFNVNYNYDEYKRNKLYEHVKISLKYN